MADRRSRTTARRACAVKCGGAVVQISAGVPYPVVLIAMPIRDDVTVGGVDRERRSSTTRAVPPREAPRNDAPSSSQHREIVPPRRATGNAGSAGVTASVPAGRPDRCATATRAVRNSGPRRSRIVKRSSPSESANNGRGAAAWPDARSSRSTKRKRSAAPSRRRTPSRGHVREGGRQARRLPPLVSNAAPRHRPRGTSPSDSGCGARSRKIPRRRDARRGARTAGAISGCRRPSHSSAT